MIKCVVSQHKKLYLRIFFPVVKKRKLSDQNTWFDRKSREGDQKHVVEVGFDKS